MILTGCGYHFTGSQEMSVGVPFVPGDKSGTLTSAIVEEIALSSSLSYGGSDAPYELVVELGHQKDQIGYQYQTKGTSGELKDKLSPVEGLQIVRARVSLRSRTGDVVFGPVEVEQSLQYDYSDNKSFSDLAFIGPEGKTQTYLNLSLGQLDAEEDASVIARQRIYRELAKKIVKAASFAHDPKKTVPRA